MHALFFGLCRNFRFRCWVSRDLLGRFFVASLQSIAAVIGISQFFFLKNGAFVLSIVWVDKVNASQSARSVELCFFSCPPRQSTPRDKKPWSDETKQSAGKKEASHLLQVRWERVILPGSAHQGMIVRTWMKSEQSRPVMLTVICLVWIGAMTPIATITDRNDRTRGGKELLAFR